MGDQQAPNEPHAAQMGTLYVKSKQYKIYEGLNVIGRNTTATVNIKDIQISKNHALIAVINANQHFIADFNSSNGTKLTSNQLIPLRLYPLDDNTHVQFAEISALYRIDCHESDAHSSNNDNTQTSQLTQDLYLKSTQLLVQENSRHVHFDNGKDSDSTTANPDDENTCDLDTSNFHDATTQVMSNEAFPAEVTFSKFEDNFHEAQTQVLQIPIPSSSKSNVIDVNSEHTDSSSSKSEISTRTEQVACKVDPPENPEAPTHKGSNNVSTTESDSDESMVFEIRPEDRQYYSSIIKRKKSNVLKSDDEDDVEPNQQNVTSSSYDDIETPVFIQQKHARKFDSDCETYYDGSNHSAIAGCEDVENDTNIIPSTQEDLSEVFNYKPLSPKPGPSNNHTFESSEDSFRLGLTQLMNKADLSESCNNNKNSTFKNTTLTESTSADHSFTDNLTGPAEETVKDDENHVEISNDSDLEMETQNVTDINDVSMKENVPLVDTEPKNDDIYGQLTQKVTSFNKNSTSSKTIESPTKETQMVDQNVTNKLPDTSVDTEGEMYVESSERINGKQHEDIDNIYVLPTQKLIISHQCNEIIEDSIDERQMPSKIPTNADDVSKLDSPSADSEFIIENTECVDKVTPVDVDDIYAQPTQKFHMSKNWVEAGENKEVTKTQNDKESKLNSIFNAETEILPQNEPLSTSTSGKTISTNMNNKPDVSLEEAKKDTDVPVCKKSPAPAQNDYNHIYSMETQVITYPKPLDGSKNKDVATINLETQTEVSFSQENLEPTRVLGERPANPLVAVLKSDTQEDDEYVEKCYKKEIKTTNKPIDDSEITKDVSEAVNDHSDLKKTKYNPESGKIKLIEHENSIAMQIVPKCYDSGNVAAENKKIETRGKKTKKQSTSNESDIEQAKTHPVTSRKTRHESLLSSSESGKKTVVTTNTITTETLDQPKSKNDVKEIVKLPKKRGNSNSIPYENVADNSDENGGLLKRSKRKILRNIDEIEQEPVTTEAKMALAEARQVAEKKSTRSSRSSNCNEVHLTSKPTKRNSRIILSGLTDNQSSQDSSSDEFEKPSEASTSPTLKQDKTGAKCDRKSSTKEEKVIKSKKNSSRTTKTLDILNEAEHKDNEARQTSDYDTKQKPPLGKLRSTKSSSRTSSPASTSSGISLPEAQVLSTRKRSQRLPNAKSPTISSTPLAKDTASTPEVQVTGRKRKQEVSRAETAPACSTPIVEDASIPQVQTPNRKGRRNISNTGSSSINSSVTSNKLVSIPEAHIPSKKRRQNVEDVGNSSTSSSENIRSSSASLSTMNTPERKKRTLKPKVVFTMMDSPLLESTIRNLGGSVVDSVAACTVLVTEKIKRTMKLLTAIGFAKPICSPKWIQESKKARQFLDPWDFILRDLEAEGKWNFSLSDSLHRSANTKLMDGLHFHILATDNIADVLKSAIEACGGKCLHRITKGDASKNIFIVTPENCKSKCLKLKKQHHNTTAVDPEGIFESVLRQQLTLKDHLIDV